jgi:hypothetical protein
MSPFRQVPSFQKRSPTSLSTLEKTESYTVPKEAVPQLYEVQFLAKNKGIYNSEGNTRGPTASGIAGEMWKLDR